MTRAVLFDMDGVVVLSSQAHFHAWRDIARQLGDDLDFDRFKTTQGTDNPGTISTLFGDDFTPEEIEDITERKEIAFRAAITADFVPVNGVTELIQTLHREGWPMALATSGPPVNVDCIMSLLPGAEHIPVRINRSMVRKAKPDPEIFLTAARLLGVPPRDCLVIEDSMAGLEAAGRAGMARLGLATSMRPDDLAPLADAVRDDLRGVTPEFLLSLFDKSE